MDDVLGIVTLGDGVVGVFSLDEEENITIAFNKDDISVTDMLEMAAENGLTFALALQPDFNGYLPQHYKEV